MKNIPAMSFREKHEDGHKPPCILRPGGKSVFADMQIFCKFDEIFRNAVQNFIGP